MGRSKTTKGEGSLGTVLVSIGVCFVVVHVVLLILVRATWTQCRLEEEGLHGFHRWGDMGHPRRSELVTGDTHSKCRSVSNSKPKSELEAGMECWEDALHFCVHLGVRPELLFFSFLARRGGVSLPGLNRETVDVPPARSPGLGFLRPGQVTARELRSGGPDVRTSLTTSDLRQFSINWDCRAHSKAGRMLF